MVKSSGSVFRVAPLLHQQCISNEVLDVRLAAMRKAIASGEDPNELRGWKNPGVGRPLYYALDNSAQHDYAQLKQNLPVIELLLEAGADARLPSLRPGRQLPIEELEAWFREHIKGGHSKWAPEDLELQPFYEAALQAMKKAALILDAHDTTSNAPALSENVPTSSRSWFGGFKLW